MKNRLEIAKRLLRDDGVIFIQCDDNEQAYLKVLMDEIFGRDNFVNNIAVKMSEATNNKMTHADKRLPKLKEYILMYKINKIEIDKNKILIPIDEWGVNYNTVIEGIDDNEIQKLQDILKLEKATKNDIDIFNKIAKNIKFKKISKYVNNWEQLNEEERLKWKYDNAHKIVRIASSSSVKKILDKIRDGMNQDCFAILSSQKKAYFVTKNYNINTKDPNLKYIFASDYLLKNPCDFWEDIKTTRVDLEGGVLFKNGKKPEKLLQRIINLSTNENDIVLDFFLGSGTTAAVAHKMNRRYIGIEQMNYIEDIAIQRLIKVLDGEQSGISKAINWQGGGSFVYCELMQNSLELIDEVLKANDKNIDDISQKVFNNERIIPFISKDELKKLIEDFDNLSLEEKRKILIKIIDFNKLYVNYSSIDDESFNVSDADKEFNKSFYEKDLK